MPALTASFEPEASDSGVDYYGMVRTTNPINVIVGHPVAEPTRLVSFADGRNDQSGDSDFWRRLTAVEMSAIASNGATDQLPQVGVPVGSRIHSGDAEARSLLTSAVRSLAPILHAIVVSKAYRTGLRILEAYYDVDRDPEEDSRELVMIVRLDSNAAQALAFWASLDYELDRWIAQLSDAQREIVLHRIGLRFVWNGNFGG